jgi:hypothetical protein
MTGFKCRVKALLAVSKKKGQSVKNAKKKIVNLREDQTCYVLITCGKPSADGKMAVEMTYEGDPMLASYLLENAQGFIEPEEDTLCN